MERLRFSEGDPVEGHTIPRTNECDFLVTRNKIRDDGFMRSSHTKSVSSANDQASFGYASRWLENDVSPL
jgi:hypothetical protein